MDCKKIPIKYIIQKQILQNFSLVMSTTDLAPMSDYQAEGKDLCEYVEKALEVLTWTAGAVF